MANLKKLICRIKLWMRQVNLIYNEKITVELLSDEEYFLRYILKTKHYLAELVIEPDGFHPHRHVSFTAFDLDKEDISSYAYYYYDTETSTEEDIFNCLDKAIAYIVS